MKISEVIKKLQEIQKEHGDIEVLSIENTWGGGEWVSLEDSGLSFDRYNEGENVLYIGMERSITIGTIKHCGECKKFVDEDAEGHGICMKDKAVYRCSDLCHIILRKL